MRANGLPELSDLLHQIDTQTPNVPKGLTRTEIATLMMSMQMQGIATALNMPELKQIINEPGGLRMAAEAFQQLSDELLNIVCPE